MPLNNKKEITILLVEDDPGHARLIEKNLRRSKITNKIIIVDDGQKALDFLFHENEYKAFPPYAPLLILLDLNIPVFDGYQVLKSIKADERTKRIPVIILTTTEDADEISKCYELGCNVYITKPVDYKQFTDAIRKMGLFLTIIQVPNEE